MPADRQTFTAFSRVLHWLMAAAILAMLGIGTSMFAAVGNYHSLVSVHRPLGVAILLLALVRLANRLFNPPPPLPASMARVERLAATAGEYTMYGLMIGLPLIGWGMLSAAHYPIVMWGSFRLPEILPHSAPLFAALRRAHAALAALFFLTILAHLAAVLFHSLVVGDGFWRRMAPWPVHEVDAERPALNQPELAGGRLQDAAPLASQESPARQHETTR